MKNKIYRAGLLLICSTVTCLVLGCVSRETVVTEEVTEEVSRTGKDWSVTESVREYKGPRGERVRDRQVVREKVKCVEKNGKVIPVDSIDECIGRGGRIVDQVKITEEVTKRR